MKVDRRSVLSTLAAAPAFVPKSAFGANDRVAYGVIGPGGRGRYLNRKFQGLGAECVALSEVYSSNMEKAVAESPKGVKTCTDYNELLAMDGVDAVVLAGPTHQHWPMVRASLKANKDIYTEKPVAWSIPECQTMMKAVSKSDRIVQVGMQRRSFPPIIECKKLLDDGLIGEISMVTAEWNWNVSRPMNNSPLEGKLDWKRWLGEAPDRDLEPARYRSWRNYKDYGGGPLADQGTHLLDVVQWFTNSGTPKTAVCQGSLQKNTGAEHCDVVSAAFTYESKLIVTWTLNYCNRYDDWWTLKFRGDEGTLVFKARSFEIYKEKWNPGDKPIMAEYKDAPGVPTDPHIVNFLDCMKTRKQPNSTVAKAAEAVSGPHLANLSYFMDRKVTMEEAKSLTLRDV
ncbi:MAG: Gfo/Idh/MocA family oxidoreductase [bacterium]|nr:Gfo/Idh/MocA family oxidoreductase [bacterium]